MAPIEHAFEAGDLVSLATLIEARPFEAWYGIPPERFVAMVGALAQQPGPQSLAVQVMSSVFASHATPGNAEQVSQEVETSSDFVTSSSAMFSLRTQGRPVEALRHADRVKNAAEVRIQPIFDGNRGWGLFSAVQHGFTAMLAGEFTIALTTFTQALMHVRVPSLSFLTRDALLKASVIEALYGDPQRAEVLLNDAEQLPRTESWVEGHVDVGSVITRAVLGTENPDESVSMLDAVPLHDIGEMWPFYAEAFHRSLLLAGRVGEAHRKQEMFEQLPLPRVEGQGYSGSVLLIHAAQRAIMAGDIAVARDRIERADGSIAITGLLAATVELVAGRPREAMNLAAELKTQSEGLRLFNLLRLSVVATGLFALGSLDECREVIRFVMKSAPNLTEWEALNFPAELREFAEAEFEEWPHVINGAVLGLETIPDQGEVLTLREQNLLRELRGAHTRAQIAKALFISINTLKSHLRSIYRKLGVNSRTAAVIEAERRGLI